MATKKNPKIAKAFDILRHSNLVIDRISPNGHERPEVVFKLDGDTITFNFKGWLCDHESSNGELNCSFNKGFICKHIIACQLYLKKKGLKRDWMEVKDFPFMYGG